MAASAVVLALKEIPNQKMHPKSFKAPAENSGILGHHGNY